MTAAESAIPQWISAYSADAPQLDGQMERLWELAEPITVIVREAFGGGAPKEVVLRSVHTEDAFYVLAQWPDATHSDQRDPYLWNPQTSSYDRPTTPDDQFALEFPLSGDFQISMLPASQSYRTDVWHWKAGRSNLGGWVDDKSHTISMTPVDGALEYRLGGYNTVYIARPMDTGQASYQIIERPAEFAGERLGSFAAQEPSGSLTDVRGKGVHNDAAWTLEMGRRFATGNPDDRQIDPAEMIQCAIAVLNDELYWEHSVSGE
ncbi:MAG: ethylbenzene dehydrogenase-related protein, partial [Pseudohongiellaceae bacterium]